VNTVEAVFCVTGCVFTGGVGVDVDVGFACTVLTETSSVTDAALEHTNNSKESRH